MRVDGREAKPNLVGEGRPGRRRRDSRSDRSARRSPEALPLPILYQDRDLIVVDKPAGMVVHPAAGHASGTLVNALLHHVDDLSGIGGERRPGIVHRLDRGTSGLMVVAKHDAAHEQLARQFHDREVEKEYIALVWGEVQAGPAHRRADRTRSGQPQEDVGPRAAQPRGRHAHRARAEARSGADARARGHPHRPHAPDSRAPERDRPSGRRRCRLRRRPAPRARRPAGGHASRTTVSSRGAARLHSSGRRAADGIHERAARRPAARARRARRTARVQA